MDGALDEDQVVVLVVGDEVDRILAVAPAVFEDLVAPRLQVAPDALRRLLIRRGPLFWLRPTPVASLVAQQLRRFPEVAREEAKPGGLEFSAHVRGSAGGKVLAALAAVRGSVRALNVQGSAGAVCGRQEGFWKR